MGSSDSLNAIGAQVNSLTLAVNSVSNTALSDRNEFQKAIDQLRNNGAGDYSNSRDVNMTDKDMEKEFAAFWVTKNRKALLTLIDNEIPKSMRTQQYSTIESWVGSFGKKWYCLWLN